MPKYVPPHIENWNHVAPEAPFRASVNLGMQWRFHPGNHLVDAEKASPGGRVILAFRMEEVRDYVVEAYAHIGAQAEEDRCDRAQRFRGAPPAFETARDYPASVAAFIEAREAHRASENEVERLFLEPVVAHLDRRDPIPAVELLISIPGDSYLRTTAISRVLESGLHDFDAKPLHMYRPTPYTAERVNALREWQRTRTPFVASEKAMGGFAHERLQTLWVEQGKNAALAFLEELPLSMVKADARSYLKFGKKPAAAPKSTEEPGVGQLPAPSF
jgi:hypothetical protein